jgi:Flp pilus assembly pilin Flp
MDIGMLHAYLSARIGLKNEKGQTLVEYALIISLIAIVAVVALKFLGGKITQIFSTTGSQV